MAATASIQLRIAPAFPRLRCSACLDRAERYLRVEDWAAAERELKKAHRWARLAGVESAWQIDEMAFQVYLFEEEPLRWREWTPEIRRALAEAA